MWKDKNVSVVFSTYNEKESVRKHIEDLFDTKVVDEVIAINNNAAEGTKEEIDKTKAIQILETKQGYGYGYQRALREATGDIIIMTEPDGTFMAKDIMKLLVYSENYNIVFGTRTVSAFILEGANMGLFLKYGNWFVAKVVEVLFNTTNISDVGCTMKLIKRETLEKIKDKFTVGSSHFGLELNILLIKSKDKYVEIPIIYNKRIGESSVTGSFWKAFKLGIVMICFTIKERLK